MGKVRCYLSNVACFETFLWPLNRTVHQNWGTVHAHNKERSRGKPNGRQSCPKRYMFVYFELYLLS